MSGPLSNMACSFGRTAQQVASLLSFQPAFAAERDMDDPAHQPLSFNDPVNIVPFGLPEGSASEADVRCFWLQPVDPHCLLTGAFPLPPSIADLPCGLDRQCQRYQCSDLTPVRTY